MLLFSCSHEKVRNIMRNWEINVFIKISHFSFPNSVKNFPKITIITFVFCYVFPDLLNNFPHEPLSWFSPPSKKLFTWFANVIIHLVVTIIWTIITCLFLLKGLAAWIALKVFHLPINNILVSVTFVISFCFHEHSWYESSNFV